MSPSSNPRSSSPRQPADTSASRLRRRARRTVRGFSDGPEYLAWRRARRPGRPLGTSPVPSAATDRLLVRSSPRPLVTPVLAGSAPPNHVAASSTNPITAIDAVSPDPGGSYLEIDPDGALTALLVRPSGEARARRRAVPSTGPDSSSRRGSIRRVSHQPRPTCRAGICRHTCGLGRPRARRIGRAVEDRSRSVRRTTGVLRIIAPVDGSH